MLEKNYKAFSAARISEMEPFIQPTLVQALSQIVLHCETNSLKQMFCPTRRIFISAPDQDGTVWMNYVPEKLTTYPSPKPTFCPK